MAKMQRPMKLALAAGAALVVGGFFGARWVAGSHAQPTIASPVAPSASVLYVPHAKGSISLDGDLDDPGWMGEVARTNVFVTTNGAPGRPYSDARFVWGDGHLYVVLYAADEDIRAAQRQPDGPVWLDDSFHMVFKTGSVERALDVSPLGILTDAKRVGGGSFDYAWNSEAHVSPELDGTLNDSSDDDEEWAIEMAIPFEALGLKGEKGESIQLAVRRCDTPKDGKRACASWGGGAGGTLVLN